ncbi:MAG: cyclic pyranopterin monophosphate synthase MoaC [Phycisphaerales bacterium]|nr:cyclic pyranopterin monophosphate synthase MoaC [Phycisphaerae bacterium]NNF43585.1 cyclic pyranopterin monophosphate synthase MoaC [Phycisphaerales bacterium]NNM24495.1 cyclic pyranopterin monophosphate synthase MoaC [Phycisphaerales bacterium]
MSREPTHIDAKGRVHMVDVGAKPPLARRATAEGFFCAAAATLDRLEAGALPKGEALATARIAGIAAAKRTDELIPLCHTLPLDGVEVDFERVTPERLRVVASASTIARTGVEMEALTAVALACLTLYDMAKAIDDALHIEGIRLVEKTKHAVPA